MIIGETVNFNGINGNYDLPKNCYVRDWGNMANLFYVEVTKEAVTAIATFEDRGLTRAEAIEWNRQHGISQNVQFAVEKAFQYEPNHPRADLSRYDQNGNFR